MVNNGQNVVKILKEITEISYTDKSKKGEALSLIKKLTNIEKNLSANFIVIEEALSFLRLQMKYMQFDLEATNREYKVLNKLFKQLKKENECLRKNNEELYAENLRLKQLFNGEF